MQRWGIAVVGASLCGFVFVVDADVFPVDDFSLECASAIITTLIRVFIDGKSYTTQTGKGLAKLLDISEADGDLLFNAASGLASAKGGINLTNKLASSANKLTQKEIEQIKNGLAANQAKNDSLAGKEMGGNSVANELTGITQKQLDKKFKHAADFGITTTKKNAETLSQYETAIKSHMGDKATKPLGTYGFVTDSKVFFNSNTNNVVVLDKSSNFVTGFKITPGTPQYENYMKNGVLR